jgi:hypothetical protein
VTAGAERAHPPGDGLEPAAAILAAMESANWLRLVYELKDNPQGADAKIAFRLPEFLNRGASTLEIARKTQNKPEDVDAFIRKLAEYDLVKVQSSGTNVRFGESLYSLTADGVQFFKQIAQGSRKSAS